MLLSVQNEIDRLRNADISALKQYNTLSAQRRIHWFQNNKKNFSFINEDLLESGYRLLLCRFNITEDEAPLFYRDTKRFVFHSMNFCPTLEACKRLGLDTRFICRHYNEQATDALIKQIDCRLRFMRNYDSLRPHTAYCEEMILLG